MKNFKILFFIIYLIHIFISYSSAKANEDIDKISKNLRCLICQGQSVYDSQSEFAISIKMLIKNQLQEGKSEEEIYDHQFSKKNLILWLFPLILFIFGGLLIYKKVFINK